MLFKSFCYLQLFFKVEDIHIALSELEELLNVPLNSIRKATRPVKKDMEIPMENLVAYLRVRRVT